MITGRSLEVPTDSVCEEQVVDPDVPSVVFTVRKCSVRCRRSFECRGEHLLALALKASKRQWEQILEAKSSDTHEVVYGLDEPCHESGTCGRGTLLKESNLVTPV